jgi:hypothetical protein
MACCRTGPRAASRTRRRARMRAGLFFPGHGLFLGHGHFSGRSAPRPREFAWTAFSAARRRYCASLTRKRRGAARAALERWSADAHVVFRNRLPGRSLEQVAGLKLGPVKETPMVEPVRGASERLTGIQLGKSAAQTTVGDNPSSECNRRRGCRKPPTLSTANSKKHASNKGYRHTEE